MKSSSVPLYFFASLLCLCGLALAQEKSPLLFDVRAFGASGDGKALDTAAINKAIDAASAAGGGTVRFPAGAYLSFSIHLKSNVALYLASAGLLMGEEWQKATWPVVDEIVHHRGTESTEKSL